MNGHDYTSTACQHGLHDRCRQRCKFCDTPCQCPCHPTLPLMTVPPDIIGHLIALRDEIQSTPMTDIWGAERREHWARRLSEEIRAALNE